MAEGADLPYQWPRDLDRIILLGERSVISQVVGRVVDAADKCAQSVDHHQLSVHPSEHIDSSSEQALGRLEDSHFNACVHERLREGRWQIG
jgi:hypothetical protein